MLNATAENLLIMEEKVIRSVEELQAENSMLRKQLTDAYSELKGRDYAIMLQRLGFLFKIVENEASFDADTVVMATDEIKEALFPKDKPKEE